MSELEGIVPGDVQVGRFRQAPRIIRDRYVDLLHGVPTCRISRPKRGGENRTPTSSIVEVDVRERGVIGLNGDRGDIGAAMTVSFCVPISVT